MTDNINKPDFFYLKSFFCIFIPALIARCVRVAYSYTATNVMSDPIVTDVLNYTAVAFTCIFIAAAYTSVATAVYSYSPSKGIISLLIFSGVYLADCIARFLLDYIGGEINSYRIMLAFISLSAEFFTAVALAFVAWMVAFIENKLYFTHESENRYSVKSALNGVILVQFLLPFIRWIYRSVKFLISVEFIPTVDEVNSIILDGVVIVVGYGILAFFVSRIVYRLISKNKATENK